ncbi:MAG: DUF6368 family protein [Phototrophicaceae bacterium]
MPNPSIDILIPSRLTDLQMQALHVWLATISSTLERRRPFARRNQRHHDHIRDQRELLLLRLQLWAEETQDTVFRQDILTLHETIEAKIHQYWHIGVTDGTQLDVAYPITNGVRPFSVDLQAFEPENWEDSHATTLELQELQLKLGAIPKYRIQLLGFLESPDDYLLCGYMAAELAQEYNGFAKVLLHPNFHTARGAAAWTSDDTQRLATSLNGVFHEIRYDGQRNEQLATYHLLDGYAMREWTKHDRFHLHL